MSFKRVRLNEFANEFGKYTDARLADYKKAALRGIVKSIPDLVEASPVDTGLYAQSWDFDETERGAIIGNYAPHAPIIEDGARPFTPPLRPLLDWAKRVLKSASQPPDYEPKVWQLAVGTRKKIAKVGIAPRHVMENAIPMIIANMQEEFRKLG